jgi:RecB family exonuclease
MGVIRTPADSTEHILTTKHLIIGVPQVRRQEALLARLEAAYDEESRTLSAQFLVPTLERAAAVREAVVAHFGGQCWTPRVDTPATLLNRHAAELGGPFRRLGVEARALLVQELAGDTPVFGRGPLTRSLARKVVGFLDAIAGGWFDGGPEVEELALGLAPATGHGPALAQLARAYDAALQSRGFMDSRRLASSLIAAWRDRGYPADARVLVIDEFALTRPVDIRLMEVLSLAFDELVITLPAPDADGPGLLRHRGFAAAAPMARWAASGAEMERVDVDGAARLERIASALFAPDAGTPDDPGDRLRVVAYPDRREEIRGVARMIRRDLGDVDQAHADLTPYTLVVSSYAAYAALVEETFREYGIPVNMPHGAPLSATPLLRVVHKLLSSVGDEDARWTIRELMDVLRHARLDSPPDILDAAAGLAGAPLDPTATLRPFSLARFARLATRAGIGDAFDADQWYARMATYLKHTRRGQDEDADMSPWDDELKAPEIEVARDLCIVGGFVTRLAGLALAASPTDFGDDALSLLRDYGLTPSDGATSDAPRGEAESEAWQAFLVLLSESVATFDAVAEPGRDSRAPDLARYICLALSSPDARRPASHPQNAVAVLCPGQSIGLSFDRLCMAGLVEGEFPAATPANFLVEAEGGEPGDMSIGLDATPVERFTFREALTNAQSVVLTYPTAHDGRTLSPSPFVDDVCALLDLSDDDVAEDPTADAGVLCAREALERGGRAADPRAVDAPGLVRANVDTLVRLAAARESVTRWSEYDNYMADGNAAVAAVLDGYTREELSATQFDTYARCPARLFYSHLLRLGGQEELEPDIAPNVRGIVIHGILEKFFSRGGPGIGVDDYDGPNARARMLECARQEFEALDEQYPNLYWEEEKRALVQGLDNPATPQGLLAGFLAAEDAQRGITFEGGYTRGRYNEVAFGSSEREDARVRLDAHVIPRASGDGDIRLKGYVDRVDADAETGRFVVFDYKTGSNPAAREALDGHSFQLAIYMDALAGREGLSTPAGGVFYSVKEPTDVRRKDPIARADLAKGRATAGMLGDEEFEQFRQVTRERVQEIEEHMRHGRFPVTARTPQQAGCGMCDYRDICRVRPSRRRGMTTEQPHYDPRPFEPCDSSTDTGADTDGEAS